MMLLRFLGKLSNLLKIITEYVGSAFMMVVIVLLFAQVLMRLFLKTNFPWAEEVARVSMIWVAMLGGSLIVKGNDLISVDFLDPYMPKFFLKIRRVVIAALLVWLCSMLAYEGYHQAMFGRNQTLSSIRLSMFWPYLAVPVGASLMLFHYFVNTCLSYAGILGMSGEDVQG